MLDTASAPPLLAEGTLVADRYRVMRCLKLGAMGGIYRVLDMKTDRFRAMKAMLPDAASDDDLRRRFEQEAVVAGRIRSEHVVAVTDSGVMRPEGTRFIVMELLDGADLGALVRDRGPLPLEEVVTLLEQTARGLDRIHEEAIVHRDLKPENIFLCTRDDGTPHVKILDFGIAKNVASLATLKTTRALGTPLYMAPEQLTGDATIDARADLYALGLVAYTLLVGKPYWLAEAEKAPSAFAFCNQVIEGARERASARAARESVTLPGAFDAWFDRAIATRPERRFASAGEQISALADVLAGRVASSRRPRARLPRARRTLLCIAAASAVGLGLWGMMALLDRDPPASLPSSDTAQPAAPPPASAPSTATSAAEPETLREEPPATPSAHEGPPLPHPLHPRPAPQPPSAPSRDPLNDP